MRGLETLKKYLFPALVATMIWAWGAAPAFGVSKEIIQMMQQLDTLQQTLQNLQTNLAVERGELRALMQQTNNNVNSMKTSVANMEKRTSQDLANANARLDSITNQIQALSESLDETKARLGKLSDQVAHTQNIIQTLNNPAASTAGASGAENNGSAGNPANIVQSPSADNSTATTAIPDPQTLYKSALSYYNGGQYQLAIQAFQQYLQAYPETDLASNAQFYIGDCYYNQGDYTRAVKEYNKCIERYPNGNKQAAAQLKKGYALLELGQKTAGERELRSLIRRFPHSREANLAKGRLKRLGATTTRQHHTGE